MPIFSHKDFQDMLPFYIARTLPVADAARLERHLATCPACRAALEEWRVIGEGVRREALRWSQIKPLPPLTRVYENTEYAQPTQPARPVIAPPRQGQISPPARWTRFMPGVLAAAVLMIVFAGLLIVVLYGASRRNGGQYASDGSLTASASPSVLVAAASTGTPTPGPTSTATLFIPTLQPTIVPSVTPIVIFTPRPPIQPKLAASPTPEPTSNASVMIVPPVETPEPATPIPTQGPGIMAAVPSACIVMPRRDVDLRAGLGPDFAIIARVRTEDRLAASGRGLYNDALWYQVRYLSGTVVLVGWIAAEDVLTEGPCADLPLVAETRIEPTPAPSETLPTP